MKKIICIFLTVALMFGCCVPAFASEEQAKYQTAAVSEEVDETLPFVLVRGMEFAGLYYDYGTENQRSVFNGVNAKEIVGTLFKALFTSLIKFDKKAGVQVIIDYANGLLGGYACNKDGSSKYDLSHAKFPKAVSNYPDSNFENGNGNEYGIVHSAMDKYGAENTYYFSYDWRMNPLDVADEINAMVNEAIAASGKSKVNLACASMGGVMTVAYLSKYGADKINKCIFLSSTFTGTYVTGDLFKGNVNFGADEVTAYAQSMLGDKKAVSTLITVLDKTGVIKGVTKLLAKFVANNKDEVYNQLLTPVFGSMLSLWAITQPNDVEPAMDYLFGDNKADYQTLIAKIRDLQSMMAARDDMLREMSDNGLGIAVLATYDRPLIPAYEHAYVSGDGTIESKFVSGGATIADIGKTLGDDYVAANPAYVSPDNMADASTCLFPDHTWLIRGAPHVSCSYGTEYSDFLFWLLDYDGRANIHSSEKYPQFMLSSGAQELRLYS